MLGTPRGSENESEWQNPFRTRRVRTAPTGTPMLIRMRSKQKQCEKLLEASREGDASLVAKLLQIGAYANFVSEGGWTPLMWAARNGHVEVVQRLLAADANVDDTRGDGFVALMLASSHNRDAIVDLLLATGASANHTSNNSITALMLAASHGHEGVVEKLLAAGANADHVSDYRNTALILAASNNHTKIVEKLLTAGADVNQANNDGDTALSAAAANGHGRVVRLLLHAGADSTMKNNAGFTALQCAELNDKTAVVELLEEDVAPRLSQSLRRTMSQTITSFEGAQRFTRKSSDSRSSDETQRLSVLSVSDTPDPVAVHAAAKFGRLNVHRSLVTKGASVSARDSFGMTALHIASENGHAECVRFLLANSADINRVTEGSHLTAIELAAINSHTAAVRVLHHAGASLQARSPRGSTLLHHAACGVGEPAARLVTFLLSESQEVDVDAVDHRGWSALHCAVESQNDAVVHVLLQRGADPNLVSRIADGKAAETALHMAVRLDLGGLVSMLLASDGVDVTVVNTEGQTPLMMAASLGRSEIVAALISSISQQYNERCHALLTGDSDEPPTFAELVSLVPLITSVYDLRLIVTLVSLWSDTTAPQNTAMVLKPALAHVVANKLVLDDDACVFFKMVLKHCEKEKLLPISDTLLLDRQAEKINTQTADWVVELKKQVNANSWRLDAHGESLRSVVDGIKDVHAMVMENRAAVLTIKHRLDGLQTQINLGRRLCQQLAEQAKLTSDQLIQYQQRLIHCEESITSVASHLNAFREVYLSRLEQEERNKKIKMVCGVIASVVGFVFAPVLKEIADAVVDGANPIELIKAVYGEEDIASFLAEKSDKPMPPQIHLQLEKYSIPVDEFETLLREEVALQHPEYLEECMQRGLGAILTGGKVGIA